MARPKLKVPLDKPQIIRVRERLKPQDQTIVVAKTADGSLVEVKGRKEPLFREGVMLRDATGNPITSEFHPWAEPVDETTRERLRVGVANQYVFKWVNFRERTMAQASGLPRWVPVYKADKEVYVPYAYGDHTDGHYHYGDTILHKRLREYDEQLKSDKEYAQDMDRYLDQKNQEMTEELSSLGAKNVEQGFEPTTNEKDIVHYTQDAEIGSNE